MKARMKALAAVILAAWLAWAGAVIVIALRGW